MKWINAFVALGILVFFVWQATVPGDEWADAICVAAWAFVVACDAHRLGRWKS